MSCLTVLDEFVNEPVVENCKARPNEEESKVVKKSDDVPIIVEWASDNEEENVTQPKVEKKIVNPAVQSIDGFGPKETYFIIRCARAYPQNYEEIDGGYVAFRGNPKGGKITGKLDHKVKVIRCDNGTEFKNREMNQFCEIRSINTACYVQNKVLVVKPHNKTPYELFHGRTPNLSFMRPFGCPVTILNTIDHLGKFNGKADEGFFVGYSLNSKAFRVFNSRTMIVEENLHIRFNENTPNVVGSRPDWLFDIDALTRTMNYEPIVASTQSNGFVGTKANDNAGQARKETEPVKDYILLPLWTADPPFSQDPKSSHDDGSKPSSDDEKNTNNVNAASTNKVMLVGGKTSIELLDDPNMPGLEDYAMNNLNITIQVSRNPTTRIHKDHPLDQVIGDLQAATQTRSMTKNFENMGM
ncbi:uncharacterized mitochondrial protein-like protein [Tanacetum coccineum]